MDAGGLAQMAYQTHNSFGAGIGATPSGFGARRGSRLGLMAPPSNISTESRQQANASPAPRTSRSHLLAGLRTAPKSPSYPSSAPPTQLQQPYGLESSRQASPPNNQYQRGVPQTSVGGSFPNSQNQQRYGVTANGQMYSLPEVLAPPELQFGDHFEDEYEQQEAAQLMATQQYFAQQQMLLQQQLLEITAAQQQMKLSGIGQQQQYSQSNVAKGNGYYNQQAQQAQQAIQPVVTQVPGTPGVYSVYNPMTGQQSYVMDNNTQSQPKSPPHVAVHQLNNSPPPISPAFRAQVSPPPEDNAPIRVFRSPSPPKKSTTPPTDVQALPPPSANAFRRNHARGLSSVTALAANSADGPKSSVPKSAGFSATPLTGTFGPGQARVGDHPIRQPRGPPSLEELVAKPTSNHEGSKNFITRQRRRAVNNLVKAGLERRGASRGSNSIDSPGTGTPSSECEITFSISSDDDNTSVGSRSDPGAIGSERKKLKARSKTDTPATTASISSEESFNLDGKETDRKAEEKESARKNPLLMLADRVEKRKSTQI